MEIEALNTLIEKYKLSEEEHNVILGELIRDLFSKDSNDNQSIMFVIGQPGCGKTTFIQNSDLSDYTIINSDNYRHLIKYSDEILSKYPTYYSKLTNYDAHLWGDELFNYAVDNGYSPLREKVPIDYRLLELFKELAGKYDLVVNIVIAGNLQSLLATRERYEKELQSGVISKLSNIDAHNKCYDLLPDFISKCIELGIKVNYVLPEDNKFQIINPGDDYLALLEQLRKKSNDLACHEYEKRIKNIRESMIQRCAPLEEFNELERIEKLYLKLRNDNKRRK